MTDVAQFARCYRPDCRGAAAGRGRACIAHADANEKREILENLRTGSPLGFARGVFFTKSLFREVINSVPVSQGVRLLHFADFRDTTFTADADFESTSFDGVALFDRAKFKKLALFNGVSFKAQVSFDKACFVGHAEFRDATFNARTTFRDTEFSDDATFRRSVFAGRASFKDAKFHKSVTLNDTTFERKPRFDDVTCKKVVELKRASFLNGVEILEMEGSPDIVMEGIALGSSSILSGPREQSGRPRLLSLRRSDVAALLIADVDLRACRFADAHNLDQLRLERGCEFARPPTRWRSRRAVIAEEHQLRARNETGSSRHSSPTKPNIRNLFRSHWRSGWYPDECRPPQWFLSDSPELMHDQSPSEIANIYRDLRKGREIGKDETGANDFYYGEMEMRRLDDKRLRFERIIVFSYWLVSGYGLRASRALICLLLTVLAFGALMYKWGFPNHVSFADAVTFSAQSTTSLFHTPERNLTLPGRWLEIGLRLLGPLFVGLALLAIRGRVKR